MHLALARSEARVERHRRVPACELLDVPALHRELPGGGGALLAAQRGELDVELVARADLRAEWGVRDAACPLSTRGGTRLVRLVRGRGGGGGDLRAEHEGVPALLLLGEDPRVLALRRTGVGFITTFGGTRRRAGEGQGG